MKKGGVFLRQYEGGLVRVLDKLGRATPRVQVFGEYLQGATRRSQLKPKRVSAA